MAFSFDRYDGSVGYDLTIITNVAVDLTDGDIYERSILTLCRNILRRFIFAPNPKRLHSHVHRSATTDRSGTT